MKISTIVKNSSSTQIARILTVAGVFFMVVAASAEPDHIPSTILLLLDDDETPCVGTQDSDNDRLLDCFETNTGIYISPENTGTDPNNNDTDGDAIDDGDEVLGTISGLDLPSMGLNPLKKNILLEYDWFNDSLECGAHSHRPTNAVIERFRSAFAESPNVNPDGSTGIAVINDYGQGGPFTGGNLINDANGVIVSGVSGTEFMNHKAANFAGNRHGYFRYVLLPHRYNTSSGSSGQAEIAGDDMIVSLYCANSTNNVANTIMHELGHNLNLRHGGDNNCNYKPNYNSVMNYRYQFPGVDTNCNVSADGLLDYSRYANRDLNEQSLNENLGVCNSPIVPVNWNGNGFIESNISFDINSSDSSQIAGCGGTLTTLTDHDDWGNMLFTGLSDSDGAHLTSLEIVDCDNPAPK